MGEVFKGALDNVKHPEWTSLITKYTQNGQVQLALKVFTCMQEKGFAPNANTYLAAFKACSEAAAREQGTRLDGRLVKQRSLEKGMAIHSLLANSDIKVQSDILLLTSLVNMYVECGSLVDAYTAFRKSEAGDVILWNTIIRGFAQAGEVDAAFQLFSRMKEVGLDPSSQTFMGLMKACVAVATEDKDGRLLERCRYLESQVANSSHKYDVVVLNKLLDTYVKCGSLRDARRVFNRMSIKDVVSWSALIMGCAQNGEGDVALELFEQMQEQNCKPNTRTFVAVLKACTPVAEDEKSACLERGRALHLQAVEHGYESDIFVANALVDMYARCGSSEARGVFERIKRRDVVTWNTMLSVYAHSGDGEKAVELFERCKAEGILPNARTYVAVLKACGEYALKEETSGRLVDGIQPVRKWCLEKGREVHQQVKRAGHETNIYVASSLVSMYARCGSLVEAREAFEGMQHHDVVTWTTLITVCAQNGESDTALQLFTRMQRECGLRPDARAFVAVLKACCVGYRDSAVDEDRLKFVRAGIQVHLQLQHHGFEQDLSVANAVVDMYANFGRMEEACKAFEKMKERDVSSWTALILGHARSENARLALELLHRMQEVEGLAPDARCFAAALKACSELVSESSGDKKARWLERGRALHAELSNGDDESDIFVANGLLELYVKGGSMQNACMVFERARNRDIASWNWMIMGYAHNDEPRLALETFHLMKLEEKTLEPDARSYFAVLKACSSLTALDTGREVHAQVRLAGLHNDELVVTSLIDFYGKCGSMSESQAVFDNMTSRKSLVAWNALLTGYGYQGDSDRVFHLFDEMQKARVFPDGITYLCVLNVCNHAGLVDEGKEYFDSMKRNPDLSPSLEHYTCLVDLLGRKNYVDEAASVVERMPVKADKVVWTTVLAAARKWKNFEVARRAFEALVALEDGEDSATYVLMGNTYAEA